MTTSTEQQTLSQQLDQELEKWKTKIDEAKLQMHLVVKEDEQELQPHVNELENELENARKQWNQLGESSEGAWKELEEGVKLSIKAMQRAFDKAQDHFPDKDKDKS